MKKIKLNFKSIVQRKARWLLTIFAMLTFGIGQSYAWYYISGDENLTGLDWWYYDESTKMNDDNQNKKTFYAKAENTYYFKLYKRVSDSDHWDQPCGSIHSATGTGLKDYGQQDGTCAAMWVTTDGVCNITFTLSSSDQLDVTVTKCGYYIKYPWWGQSGDIWSAALADCYDGVHYFTIGRFNGASTYFYYGRKDSDGGADSNSSGGSDEGTTTNRTASGNPASNDLCYFVYDPANHALDIKKKKSVVQPNHIYFDNSNGWSNKKIYFVIGHSENEPYQRPHLTEEVRHTNLRYTCNTTSWSDDVGYYAMIGTGDAGWTEAKSAPSTLNDAEIRSALYWDYFNLAANNHYLVTMESGDAGTPIEIEDIGSATSGLNNSQTIKYSISRDGGSTYSELNSGVTPAEISIASYKFEDGTYDEVVASDGSITENQSSTYSTSVDVAYTGATTLDYTDMRDGYTFIGWYTTASGSTGHTTSYNPTTDETVYARFKAHRYTIAFDANDANYPGKADGSTASVTNVVYDQNATLTSNGFTRAGYTFAGWTEYADGSGASYDNGESVSNLTATDNGSVTLYAKWNPKPLTISTGGNWKTAGSWTDSFVPTSEHPVTISAAVEVNTTDAVAKSVTIDGGSLTIKKNGVLNVAGAISNSTSANIVIETAGDGQGALIYDISKGSPAATVSLNTSESSTTGDFQYIASPVGGVSVASTLSGPGVYTYAWIEGKGWDRRGYYDEFAGNEVIVISGKAGCTFSGTLNPTTSASITCTASPESTDAQGVNMIPNTLTAPIKIAAMDLSATYDGAIHIWNGSGWDEYPKLTAGENVIPAFQGYGVLTATGGTVSFDYTTAVRNASTHNNRLQAPQRAESDIYDHITIGVTTNDRKVDMLLYENAQFTTGVDKGWEAVYMEGDGRYGELYAHAEREMSILATSDLEGTVLGFAPGQADSYTISFEGDGKGYYLNDVMKEESTLIEEGNTYEFSADEATNATRFVISKTPISKTPTSVGNLNDGVKARKQLIDGALYIIRDGRIYTTTGSVVQ